jgi:hypothetical protein
MRFNLPQFVTIEDKIPVGFVDITIRQLFLLFGGFLISYAAYKFLPGTLALVIIIIVISLVIIIGWVKINNKYVISFLPKLIKILFSNRRFIWKEEVKDLNKISKVPEIEKYLRFLEEQLNKDQLTAKEQVDQLNLNKLLQFSHKHNYNPKDPYLNFPLPKFPKKQW